MTYEEIVENGLSRAMDFGNDFPMTRRPLYRRIEIRQAEIFTAVGRANPDYFGVNTVGVLDVNRDVILSTLDTEGNAIDPSTSITRVEIQDPGSHPTLACRDEVSIITPNDPDAAVAPRMTLRNFTLHAYGDDMDGVTSVCIYYSYRPAPKTTPLDGSETAELPSVYQELLVLDIVKWLLRQSISMDTERKAAAMGLIEQEEAKMMEVFMAEAADYAGAQQSRFGSVAGSQKR